MKRLVLIRHGESVWNKENRFTGWTDVDLSERGLEEAHRAGILLRNEGFRFAVAHTSCLKRAIKTLNIILDEMDLDWIPVYKNKALNEKHYGILQGLNKAETAAKYGDEQVHIWRRSYDIAPNPLEASDPRAPHQDPRYARVDPQFLPLTESLKDTVARVAHYWMLTLKSDVDYHGEVIVSAHGNTIRAFVKHLKDISDSDITALNIPTGIPYVFEFDDQMQLIRDYFLGDPEEIAKLQATVANQGKSH